MKYTFQHNGQAHSVTLERLPDGTLRAVVDDRAYVVQATPTPAGGWLLQTDDDRAIVTTAAHGEARFVHVDGHTFTLTVPQPRSTRRRGASAAGGVAALNAQMPGKVTAVLVAAGETVERGQALVILEAMKMEIRVSAAQAGRVARVLVEAGQVVERGQPLVEVEGGD